MALAMSAELACADWGGCCFAAPRSLTAGAWFVAAVVAGRSVNAATGGGVGAEAVAEADGMPMAFAVPLARGAASLCGGAWAAGGVGVVIAAVGGVVDCENHHTTPPAKAA